MYQHNSWETSHCTWTAQQSQCWMIYRLPRMALTHPPSGHTLSVGWADMWLTHAWIWSRWATSTPGHLCVPSPAMVMSSPQMLKSNPWVNMTPCSSSQPQCSVIKSYYSCLPKSLPLWHLPCAWICRYLLECACSVPDLRVFTLPNTFLPPICLPSANSCHPASPEEQKFLP